MQHFVDNRDIRDNYYNGNLIIPYNDNNFRHKNIVGKISNKEAFETILYIMEQDIIYKNRILVTLKKYLKDVKSTPKYLKFESTLFPFFYKSS